ncbi:MAG: efflux RND transporter periplasmic adaptor subunit [Thermodesulfobacteriota bacterium]
MFKLDQTIIIVGILLIIIPAVHAQEKKMGRPPARVVVADVTTGMIAPEAEFVGTVYFQEVSELASEVSGRVEAVHFEEGQRVKIGKLLVTINADILRKNLQATRASYEQVLADLERSRRELERKESLFKEELLSEREYDEYRFVVKGLEKKSASLLADVERLEVELEKKSITTPFNGIVLQRDVDRGEWLAPGTPVATIGKDDMVDIVVDIPERVVSFVRTGLKVEVRAGGHTLQGRVIAVVPKGDVSTRTFPAKIRVKNDHRLIEGMEARVRLPQGEGKKSLVVKRDAVITMFGRNVLFAAIDGKAVMVPVRVVGYEGMTAGVAAEGLKEGMKVVVKGNERLKDGQAISY